MKTFRNTLLITSLLAAIGSATVANAMGPGPGMGGMGNGPCMQADGMPGMGGRGAMNPEKMQARRAQHQAALKAKLKLAPDQEAAWTAFAAAPAPGMGRPMLSQQDRIKQRAEMATLSTPERLDKMQALRTQHQTEMNAAAVKHAEAVKTFYAVLSAEQKKVFDDEHALMAQRANNRHGRMGARPGSGAN